MVVSFLEFRTSINVWDFCYSLELGSFVILWNLPFLLHFGTWKFCYCLEFPMFASLWDLQRLFVFGTLLATLEFTTCVQQFYHTGIFTFYLQKGLKLQ